MAVAGLLEVDTRWSRTVRELGQIRVPRHGSAGVVIVCEPFPMQARSRRPAHGSS